MSFTQIVVPNPALAVTANSAYSSGQQVGSKLTLSLNARSIAAGGGHFLQSVVVIDKSSQSAPFQFWIFNQDVTGTNNDKTTFAPTAANLSNVIARLDIQTTDYKAAGANASIAFQKQLEIALQVADTTKTNLYGFLVTTGTPTYVNTTDLIIKLGVQSD